MTLHKRMWSALHGAPPPRPEVVMRAMEGDPLALIELGEYREHCHRSARGSRKLMLACAVFQWVVIVTTCSTVTIFGRSVLGFQTLILALTMYAWTLMFLREVTSRRPDDMA